ncbi:hypothetical protein E2C01_027777 [Portunus trituberculatus]|uniref:Uncharacterized protein n=1 Tax=Portunus trituberculatus TaxID=210409 RepID=A0A5B7EIR3_PORTR|nr:hypothetical protein [Portunus trituberculatus]
MKPNKEAHKRTSLVNVKLKTNSTQECMVNGEEPTWQNPRNKADRSQSCEISKPACQKIGAKAEQYSPMDGEDKCFVSPKKKKKKVH